ncbi:unnamed protein product [Merluccius merluccius]
MATMDAEDFIRTDVDTVTVLACDDDTKQQPECSEVEDLQNSLRQAVHDETVRPKMQCLMMDPSFSMVAMQGEDSGIEWETSASRCTTPWASEAGNAPLELYAAPSIRPPTPGALPAGRIIIVMDEESISRRKKTKDRAQSASRIKRQQREALEEQGEVVGRPELVGFSLPNVKADEEQQKDVENTAGDHEQQLFCLVAEGSEILNIVVPPILASVDEEESTVMEDNLSYLEESPVIKSSGTTDDSMFEFNNDVPILTQAVARFNANEGREVASNPYSNVMDPPGAPVMRPQARGTTSNVDYFENFSLIDAQSPGSPAVIKEGQEKQQTEEQEDAKESQDNEEPSLPQRIRGVHVDEGETDLGEEDMVCALLDDVFYGGTNEVMIHESSDIEQCRSPRSPLKKSGSALFGSQDDILTPIFLPEGPAKIIDPILFEEPKAMAFLYTDLYEEAIGSRIQEEDTESLASEKSFHSRHSDREARGYLEKYVLKDETPVLETTKRESVPEETGGVRLLSQDSYDFGDLPANPGKANINNGEDEITDFFRSSGNSSPCDMNPFDKSDQEEDEAQAKIRARLEVIQATQQMFPSGKARERDCTEDRTEPTEISEGYEFVAEDKDWSSMPEDEFASSPHGEPGIEYSSDKMPMPVAPPRKKVSGAPKTSLDLTPLSPVEGPEEGDVAGVKEQRVEDKETASPAETADEGEGEQEESSRQPSDSTADTTDKPGIVKDEGGSSDMVESSETDKHTDISSTDSAKIELRLDPEGMNVTESTGGDVTTCPHALVPEPAKEKGQCIIL